MENDLDNPEHYVNREFGTLAFNERVLHLARNKRIPLLERMRFLCICSSNLDEFFEIRVAGLKEKIALASAKKSIDGLTPQEVFDQVSEKAHNLTREIYAIFNQLLIPAMEREKIYFLTTDLWSEAIQQWAKEYFKRQILPIVSPIALDLAHPFPRLFNKGLNFIIDLEGKDAFDRNIDFAIVHAPHVLPRMIQLPAEACPDEGQYFVYLSSIIQSQVHVLFPGMTINGCYPFRLTRNSDLFLTDEETEDLAVAVQREIFSRHYGLVVRLEIDKKCPETIVNFLLQKHYLNYEDAYFCDGPVNLRRYYQAINEINRSDLNYPPFWPIYPQTLLQKKSLFDILDEQDVLLHHPYESYDVVIDFVRQAAMDPEVLAIKQTLYRTHASSVMVRALIDAARSGKEITAVIELRARFDEESNLKLATDLHEAGVLVLYGVMGYKTHAKMTLVVKRIKDQLKRYVHVGTGNYHEQTAKLYTDFGLLTSHAHITSDIQLIFQQLTGLGKILKSKVIYQAPFTLQSHLIDQIEACIEAAKMGQEALIYIKVNGVTDQLLIDWLYSASQHGVKIKLIVRSICCLKPGIPNLSDNIEVISVLGRFLEHHRVFYFKAGSEEFYYCASADLMERNLYNRIEILFPIFDPKLQQRIHNEIFNNYFKDNKESWEMLPDGSYKQHHQGQYSAQESLMVKYGV